VLFGSVLHHISSVAHFAEVPVGLLDHRRARVDPAP